MNAFGFLQALWVVLIERPRAVLGTGGYVSAPVAFASDHLETLFELGIEYRRVAKEAGVEQYEVTTGLNDSPKFIEALSELVLVHLGHETEQASGAAN